MIKSLMRGAFRALPAPARDLAGGFYGRLKIAEAKKSFENCTSFQSYLPADAIAMLMKNNYPGPGEIRYDEAGLVLRAQEKMRQLKQCLPSMDLSSVLELGCADGMVCAEWAKRGVTAYGADLEEKKFDDRAKKAGAKLLCADVTAVPLPDSSVHLVYSFAAFEHFSDPAAVLKESWRLLKPGGLLYLSFGPVYTSPYGRHAYRQIPIPYCHYLFTEEDLKNYAKNQHLWFEWPYVNGWTVAQYRMLLKNFTELFETLYYKEHPTGGVGAELIRRYPACFKGRTTNWGDFFVSAVEFCWRKK